MPRPLRWDPRKPAKPWLLPISSPATRCVMAPTARARISIETLRGVPSCVTSDSCFRLRSRAGRPAGVYRIAPRSTSWAVRTRRFMRPARRTAATSSGRGLLMLMLRLGRLAGLFLLDHLHHDRGRRLGLALDHREVAQHGVVEAEAGLELGEHVLAALDVDAQVVRLRELLDQVGHLATAPVLHPVHLAAAGGDDALVAFQHGRNLLALIRMDQEHDLIVTHVGSSWVQPESIPGGEATPKRPTRVWQGEKPMIIARRLSPGRGCAAPARRRVPAARAPA